MLGYRLIRDAELALQKQLVETQIDGLRAELAAAKEYARKCEALIEHERERIDSERERADRIADSLFQANGLPATSETVLREERAAETVAGEKRQDYMKELLEIYGETESELVEDGAEPLPEPLANLVQ
ncbi:MAG TPA: hypothetical protein VI386_17885 [Candidatus Sulfotelmatobacter sp.]